MLPTDGPTAAPVEEMPGANPTELRPEELAVAEPIPLELIPDASLGEYVSAWLKRVRGGESGVLPVVAGLIVIIIIFQIERSRFLSALNLVNLLQQSAQFIVLGMAEIFVLLLGEIDLSLGFSGAVGAAVMTILAYPPINFGWGPAILCGLATSAAIGFVQGQIITRLRLPPFVVTLGGLLFWEGFLIWLVNNQSPSNGGSIRILNTTISNIEGGRLSIAVGWILLAVFIGVFALVNVAGARRRRASGLVAPPLSLTLAKVGAVAAGGIAVVAVCSVNRSIFAAGTLEGVPWVVPIVLVLVIAWTFLLGRTRFGRYVYAIGGNREAARRAGINVEWIRVLAYTLAGFTAAAAIIILDSYQGGATSDVNGGELVLYGVAAAVIGGTSLLGGRGKMVHALLGGLVIATIYNGMGLLSLQADIQYMVTALVLVAAATVDALSRRGHLTKRRRSRARAASTRLRRRRVGEHAVDALSRRGATWSDAAGRASSVHPAAAPPVREHRGRSDRAARRSGGLTRSQALLGALALVDALEDPAQAVDHGRGDAQLALAELVECRRPQRRDARLPLLDQLAPRVRQARDDDAPVGLGARADDEPGGRQVVEHLRDGRGRQRGRHRELAGRQLAALREDRKQRELSVAQLAGAVGLAPAQPSHRGHRRLERAAELAARLLALGRPAMPPPSLRASDADRVEVPPARRRVGDRRRCGPRPPPRRAASRRGARRRIRTMLGTIAMAAIATAHQ